ncbi:MAG: hypothetical protein R2779_06120 [Crocinitomicaceae bacterium]
MASGKNYGIIVKADGYLFHSENFDIPKGAADNLVIKNKFELKNIKIEAPLLCAISSLIRANLHCAPESTLELIV